MYSSLRNFYCREWLISLAGVILLILLTTPPVYAADISVNSGCSLANAITAANTDSATGGCAAGSGTDTISLSGSITLSSALPQLTKAVTINGNGHTIDGAGSHRIFDIATAYNGDGNSASQRVFTINNLTMQNGRSSEGGAIRVNGARADNLASLTLSNCNVWSSNSSGHAGGIFARNALLNIQSSTLLSSNSAAHSGGGIWADASTVNVIGGSSLISNSAGDYGGSIHAIDSTMTINNAAVTESSAADNGGGIAYFYGAGRTVTVVQTVISNNSAVISGGGFYANLQGTIDISWTTFFGNTVGGSAQDYQFEGFGTVTIDGDRVHG